MNIYDGRSKQIKSKVAMESMRWPTMAENESDFIVHRFGDESCGKGQCVLKLLWELCSFFKVILFVGYPKGVDLYSYLKMSIGY